MHVFVHEATVRELCNRTELTWQMLRQNQWSTCETLSMGDTGRVNCLSCCVLTLSAMLDHGKKLHRKLLTSVSCRARGITFSLSAHACSEAELFLGLRAQGVSFLEGKRWFRGSCWGKLAVKTKEGKRNAISVMIEDWAYQGYWGIVSLVN